MSVKLIKENRFWWGKLPKRVKKLRTGWKYIEETDAFLRAKAPDGTIFFIHPKTGKLTAI